MTEKVGGMRCLGIVVWLVFCVHSASAEGQRKELTFGQLPKNVTDHINSVRKNCIEFCKEAGCDFKVTNQMDGVKVIDLSGDGSLDILVSNEDLCYGHRAGVNCSNRGCDVLIWKQVGQYQWRRVFDEHAHRYFLSIDEDTGQFNWMAISIYAGDPRCHPKPGRYYTSGKSCDLIAHYRNGKWVWRK